MVNTIGVCGFSATGSGAYVGLLREFGDTAIFDKCEFILPYYPDGLEDLKYQLTNGSAKFMSSCLAIERFERACRGNPFRLIDEQMSEDLGACAHAFLDEITQCKWIGKGSDTAYYGFMRDLVIRLVRKLKLGQYYQDSWNLKGERAIYPFYEMRYSCNPQNFDHAARNLVREILGAMGYDGQKSIVLDQPFAANNPQASFPFFDNPLAIVVDRDPRDYYILCKNYYFRENAWRAVPVNSVENFVTYYKTMREGMPYTNRHESILRVMLEDLIYEYDSTVKAVSAFCGLSEHLAPRKYFDPEVSINNTQLFLSANELCDDIGYIETHLTEYLFPFERYPRRHSFDQEKLMDVIRDH